MSIQPGYTKSDLDRTDELPVLDVEAYEASLTENQQGLSRTDTWHVEPLQDMDELTESAQTIARTPARHASKESTVVAETLTVNVERILKRIAQLESDITTAHETNVTLQKRSKAIEAERDQHSQRMRVLEGENARLAEHRVLADEMTARLEQQLREQSQRADAELEELNRAQRDQLQAAVALAEERAKNLAALEKAVTDEKNVNKKMAGQLAAKLRDCERMSSAVEQRDRSIQELTEARDALSQRLEQELASGNGLATQLAAAEQTLQQSRAALLEHERASADKDEKLAQLTQDLERTHRELATAQQQQQTLSSERDALLSTSAQLAERTAELEQSRIDLAQLQKDLAAARAEMEPRAGALNEATAQLEAARAKLSEQSAAIGELERALQTREEMTEGLIGQLQTARDEHAIMSSQVSKLRTRVKSLTQQVFSRDNEIAALQADLAVHSEALDAIRRDVNRIGGHTETEVLEDVEYVLEPVEHSGDPIHLDGRSFTVGRTNDNDIALPSHLVSRHHARLMVGPTGVIVEDEGSTNGCFVNGEQVRQRLMHDGDVLELGDLRYRLCTRSVTDTNIRGTTLTAVDSSPSSASH